MMLNSRKFATLSRLARADRATLRVLVFCVVILAIVELAPRWPITEGLWRFLYEGLRLYRLWPLLVLITALSVGWLIFKDHQKNGQPQFVPVMAGLAWMVFTGYQVWSVVKRSADQPLNSVVLGLILLSILDLILGIILLNCNEYWHLLNQEICNTIYASLEKDSLISNSRALTRLGKTIGYKSWGSPHKLRLVQGYYEQKRKEVMRPSIEARDNQDKLLAYLKAGRNFLYYLAQQWPDEIEWPSEIISRNIVSWWQSEVQRELVLMYFLSDSRPEQWKDTVYTWIGVEEMQDTATSYRKFMAYFYGLLKNNGGEVVRRNEVDIVREILDRYESLPELPVGPQGYQVNARDTCACTWLALAEKCVSTQTCFDVWMEMRRSQADLFISSLPGNNGLAQIAASASLKSLYGKLRDETPKDWQAGLAGRFAVAEQYHQLIVRN